MADNFNLRAFLTENKLTKNAKLLKEEVTQETGENVVSEASYFDSYDSEAANEVGRQLTDIVDIFSKGGQQEREEIDAAIAAAEQATGTQVTPSEKRALLNHAGWIRTHRMEMEREYVDNKKPVMENLTAKERRLVEMVHDALGVPTDDLENTTSNDDAYAKAFDTMEEGEEMVQENPLPKYKNIDELMSNIEHGTNEAAHKYKMERMKEVAEALEAKVTSLEEGENAEHIDQKAVKQMRKDILALRKAEEKLRKEFDKKFAAKKEKKEKALQEGTLDLKESAETRTIPELGDFQGTLGELQSIISNLIQEYGESAMLTADAGHNNVEFIITV